MTKVQTTFPLGRALADADYANISRMHSVYGFIAVRIKPAGDELFVEYDASRLSRKEVLGSLQEHGLPVNPPEPATSSPEATTDSPKPA